MSTVALSTLIVSSQLGPTNFGFVASVIAISSFFSTSLIGPITTLILREPITPNPKIAMSTWKMYAISCAIYIIFLLLLFIIKDERILQLHASVYLIIVMLAGLNSLITAFFFSNSKISKVNIHSISPEIIFLIIILILLFIKELTIENVLIAWISQATFAIFLVVYQRKNLLTKIFKRYYHKYDFVSSIMLGVQNLFRDRAILIIGPLLFSFSDLGKLAFYLMIIKIFISLNGSLANLIISKKDAFNEDRSLIKNWIYLLILTTAIFFLCVYLFNQTNILIDYHINEFQILSISATLFFSFLFSLQLNNIYANYQLKPFAIYQTIVTFCVLFFIYIFRESFDLFFINAFIVTVMSISIAIYSLVCTEKKLKKM